MSTTFFNFFFLVLMTIFITIFYHTSSCKRTIPIFYKRTLRPFIGKNSLAILVFFSLCWLLIAFVLMQDTNPFRNLLKSIIEPRNMKLNEWGDFLAGFIAPLALGWLAYGIFYQMEEFKNVVKSFVKQQTILQEQANQIAIQRNYMWYDRNSKKMFEFLSKIEEANISNNDSPQSINLDFDISENGNKYFNVFDEIKDIVALDDYISKTLNKNISRASQTLREVLEDLQLEYDNTFGSQIKNSKQILLKIYFCTSLHNIEVRKGEQKYSGYKKFTSWINERVVTEVLDKIIRIKEIEQTKLANQIDIEFVNIMDKEYLLELNRGKLL